MATAVKLDWFGDKVKAKVLQATKNGLEATAADCVADAVDVAHARHVTGTLARSIKFEPARDERGKMIVRWGSYNVGYALWQEIGTKSMTAWKGPYLRPAAAKHYPQLAANIREEYKRL